MQIMGQQTDERLTVFFKPLREVLPLMAEVVSEFLNIISNNWIRTPSLNGSWIKGKILYWRAASEIRIQE